MMLSLGWEEPIFTTTWHVDFYKCTCQVDLRPRFGSLVCHTEGITTKGEAKDTKAEARESAAEAAILSLEMVCSVYHIDINYNKRSLAEARVLETESILNASAQLLSEIQSD
jgi:hypothetical protein